MAIKIEGIGWACSICNRIHPSATKADVCRDEHDMIFIPMSHTELNRLLQGIMLGDLSMIPESIIHTLRKYQKANYKT